MNRKNAAIQLLSVFTVACVLYLAGCFGTEEPTTANPDVETKEVATPEPTPTVLPVVTAEALEAESQSQFYHTVVQDDRVPDLATKYGTTLEQILIANPGLNPDRIFLGDQILIPGATTDSSGANLDPTDRAPGESVDYAIKEGDTFGTIANEFTVSVAALEEANPGVEAHSLQISHLIVIPPYGTGLSAAQLEAIATTVPLQRDPGQPAVHIVEAGDILSSIADAYSVTVDQIIEANNIADPDNVNVGTELLIPPPLANPSGD